MLDLAGAGSVILAVGHQWKTPRTNDKQQETADVRAGAGIPYTDFEERRDCCNPLEKRRRKRTSPMGGVDAAFCLCLEAYRLASTRYFTLRIGLV